MDIYNSLISLVFDNAYTECNAAKPSVFEFCPTFSTVSDRTWTRRSLQAKNKKQVSRPAGCQEVGHKPEVKLFSNKNKNICTTFYESHLRIFSDDSMFLFTVYSEICTVSESLSFFILHNHFWTTFFFF